VTIGVIAPHVIEIMKTTYLKDTTPKTNNYVKVICKVAGIVEGCYREQNAKYW
jgi:hypothetical protein